jgi:hypothetical protein
MIGSLAAPASESAAGPTGDDFSGLPAGRSSQQLAAQDILARPASPASAPAPVHLVGSRGFKFQQPLAPHTEPSVGEVLVACQLQRDDFGMRDESLLW